MPETRNPEVILAGVMACVKARFARHPTSFILTLVGQGVLASKYPWHYCSRF